jgi:hypothetical protein
MDLPDNAQHVGIPVGSQNADIPTPNSHEQQEQTWLQLNEAFQRPKVKGWKTAFRLCCQSMVVISRDGRIVARFLREQEASSPHLGV